MTSDIYVYPGSLNPAVYEQENLIADPDQRIEAHMWSVAPPDGAVLLDVGAGSGFHSVRYAGRVRHLYAVEPDANMLRQFHARLAQAGGTNISLLATTADHIPLAPAIIDIAYSRFAYFFGTDACLPGIREVERLLKPGGHFFIIDNYVSRGLFGRLCQHAYGHGWASDAHQAEVVAFYERLGFDLTIVDSCWRAPDRGRLRQVIEMEFPAEHVEWVMDQIPDVEISYAYAVYHDRKEPAARG